jgi:transcriptional regulator with XRE-family HTH domain
VGGGKLYLAQNLRYLREQKGLSQREFSEIFGLSSSAVTMWEREQRKPDIEMIVRLSEYFDVTLDELVLKELKPPLPLYALNIKYLRKKKEITQEDMAVFLGFSGKSSLCAVETGKIGISIENLEKLADFFGVTLDQMVKHDLSKEGV